MKNIHVLPTDKGTGSLAKSPNTKYYVVSDHNRGISDHIDYTIYITSDDEIKEGDWIYYTSALGFCKTTISSKGLEQEGIPAKKIILTTDQDLIKDGVQAIDDTFLKWFVKNPSCERVEVSIMNKGYNKTEDIPYQEFYKIIIPKEPKPIHQQIIDIVGGEDRFRQIAGIKPKQETLEETGKRVSELVDAMDSNMEMFSITNQIDELGYAVSNMRDIIHEIVKILDVK
jgi:hypothetical protein